MSQFTASDPFAVDPLGFLSTAEQQKLMTSSCHVTCGPFQIPGQVPAQPPAPRVPPMVEEFTVNPLGFLSDATSQQLEAEFARQKAVNVCDLGFIGEPLP